MPDAPPLPELARSLRAAGDTRSPDAAAASQAVFVPLIEARTRANGKSKSDVLASLNGAAIAKRIDAQVTSAVTSGITNAARARSLAAEALHQLAPLHAALEHLDLAAAQIGDDNTGWNAWVDALRSVFFLSDGACRAIAALIGNRGEPDKQRWFRRGSR